MFKCSLTPSLYPFSAIKLIAAATRFSSGTKRSRHQPNHMSRAQDVMTNLLAFADIRSTALAMDIQVHDQRFFNRVLASGTLGFGDPTWTAGGTATPWMRCLARHSCRAREAFRISTSQCLGISHRASHKPANSPALPKVGGCITI